MSRIGKKPVALPSGVTASVEGTILSVKGPKGTLSMPMMDDLVSYKIEDGQISIVPVTQAQRNRAAWGMQRTNVQNLVTGVTEGFSKVLEITGVGYRATAQGKNLKLQLGYQPRRQLPGARRRRGQTSRPEYGRDQRHRQAAGRSGRGGNPPLAQARAVQGQGHQVPRRVYLPQRRQEEVSHGETLSLRSSPSAGAHHAPPARCRQASPQRSSLGPAHLCPGHRRHGGDHPGRGFDPGQGPQGQDRRHRDGAAAVGKALAERAKKAGVSKVIFDRGGFLFHGRVKALADAAREGELEF